MIRVGILGTDSSHADVYLDLMNSPNAPYSERARVVHMWGAEAPAKARYGATAVDDLQRLLNDVDVAMVCGRWGEDHYELAKAAMTAGIPTFIDKPLTNSPAQAHELVALAESADVPTFSCSPLRFCDEVIELQRDLETIGTVAAGSCSGLAEWLAFGPRGDNVYFYGVHVVDVAHAVFGPGAQAVRVEQCGRNRTAVVRWNGQTVTLNLLSDCAEFCHVSCYGVGGWAQAAVDFEGSFYERTLGFVLAMAETGKPPIPLSHAVEVIDILAAIESSSATGEWTPVGGDVECQ